MTDTTASGPASDSGQATAGMMDAPADRALKRRHRAVWASGDYPGLAMHVIPSLGEVLVEAAGIGEGMRVLDVAAGAGHTSIPAALRGADVVASDLTPELFVSGRRQAAERGAVLEWVEADAEALPFADGEFDAVMSCIGVMFAPHHRAAADELVRVVKPGGTIALLSWTPTGFVGQLLGVVRGFVPPPPPGVEPPPRWGDETHVRDLLGTRAHVTDVHRQSVRIDQFDTPDGFRHYFKTHYGPTVAAYAGIAGDAERTASLDRELVALAERHDDGEGDEFVMHWEYLLLVATRA